MSGLSKSFIDLKIQTRRIMVFAKSNDPDSIKVKEIFDQYYLPQGNSSSNKIQSNPFDPPSQIPTNGSTLKNVKIVDN